MNENTQFSGGAFDYRGEDIGIDPDNYKFEEIEEHYKGLAPRGYQVLIRIYTAPVENQTKAGLWLPPTTQEKKHELEQFCNNVGLVVKLSSAAYKDTERYKYTGEYCALGEWVHFDRHAGLTSFRYKGWTSLWLYEDKVLGVVDDPRHIERPTKN